MKMKNIEIINAINGLEEFIKKDIQLPYNIRRAIVKNRQTLIEEYKIYDAERVKLQKTLDDANTTDDEKMKVREQIVEMLNTEFDLNVVEIPEEDLNIDGLTVRDELALDFMIKKESEEVNND